MAAIDALGPVRWLIVPSGHHRMDAAAFAARYPACQVLAPAGLGGPRRPAGPRRRRARPAAGRSVAGGESLDGVPAEAVLVHRAAGEVTLVFNDSFMNLPDRLPGFRGWVVKVIGSTGGPKVTGPPKWFIVKERAPYAEHLRRLAATPGLARIVPGHGDVVRTEAAAALIRAADRLHRA